MKPVLDLGGRLVVEVGHKRVQHANPSWGFYTLIVYRYVDRPEDGGGTMPAAQFYKAAKPTGKTMDWIPGAKLNLPPMKDDINIPVKKGDTILVGKWKNHPIKVTSFGTDDHDMPTVNGRKVVNFRIPKEQPTDEGRQPMKKSWKIMVGGRLEGYREADTEEEAASSYVKSYNRDFNAERSGTRWQARFQGKLTTQVPSFQVVAESVRPMKMLRSTLRALIEAELAELGPKMTRLAGRYGGEPDVVIADPGNKDVPNSVVQVSKKGGKNESVHRPRK